MSDCEELFLDIDGVRTRLLKGGSGPALLYWHGAGAGEQWFPHHVLLAQHFTVYAPDHPGWGGSDNPEWDSIQDYVLHYDAVLRVLNLEKPVLVGHSLGGWMAAAFAVTYPDRLRTLVLMNAAGVPFDQEPVPDFFATAARGGSEFAQMLFHNREVAAAFLPAHPTLEDTLRFHRELTSTARLAWDRWFDDKLLLRARRILSPTLVLWGAQERLFPVSLGRKLADVIPGAQFQIVEECGHMLPFENPPAFAQAVVAFVQEASQS